MDRQKIKKVYVVYKTHLDIGFTDMGKTVLDRYVKEYIPKSVRLALKLNTPEHKKFVWTLGSYLIDYYLKCADPKEREEAEEAIQKGYLCWHGLPCTTYTELLDLDLFRYGLSIGQKLDRRFGRKTIAAKMTDVPGHTAAIVAPMADAGIRFLHIGVNPSSKVPCIPETFVWKYQGEELIVQYSAQYGLPGYVEGMDEVLEFAHTADNLGPQSEKEIDEEMKKLGVLYPNAEIEAAALDDYAKALLRYKEKLPVVEEEIGDTWIHGTGTDPWKVTRYRTLIALKDKWKQEGKLSEEKPFYEEFMTNLLLIAEHTWGMDFKKYLADFKNWEKADFRKARETDVTTWEEHLTNRNAYMKAALQSDMDKYRGGVFSGSYHLYEQSCMEQREYLENAVNALPQEFKKEVEAAYEKLEFPPTLENAENQAVGRMLRIGGWKLKIAGDGSVRYLKKGDREWISGGEIGLFQYEVFDGRDCMNNFFSYNREFEETASWAEADFSKPGLEYNENVKHQCYDYHVLNLEKAGEKLLVSLEADEEASEKYGAPRNVWVQYTFLEDTIRCLLKWTQKDANKIPEALWFGFRFDVENPVRWVMDKMGAEVSPLNVVRGGNRLQHCVEALRYQGADGRICLKSLHAPLVSVGGRRLYSDCEQLPDMNKGFCFNLFNNRWGTNFPMWCEDDGFFRFEIEVHEF